ncbi:MAG: phaN [Candidatus Berkelbacteria bacterium]|nr:phaN [Candidatus Berkelbacteria bacterium]
MDEIQIEKTKIISRQILLYFIDFFRLTHTGIDKKGIYKIAIKEYDKFREKDKIRFSREIYRLKQKGFIKKYLDGQEQYLELTTKGKEMVKKYIVAGLKIDTPSLWDKKWRIVIYDISNDKKNEREFLRRKLQEIGFIKIQESVFVYPFECLETINALRGMFYLGPHVQYIIAERIETEQNLIKKFLDRGILSNHHIK